MSSDTGLSGSDWDKLDLPKSLAGDHKSDPGLEGEFENLDPQRGGASEPGSSQHDSLSMPSSECMSLVDRDADWEEFGERVEYP
jgi:hypothetical protein